MVHIRARDMIEEGIPKRKVLQELGVKKDTLNNWIRGWRLEDPSLMPAQTVQLALKHGRKVSDVRSVLTMLDDGEPIKAITEATGVHRLTIRRWQEDPRYREATYEYDPLFDYDADDLLDRAVVAQHLCRTADVGERFDLLMAAVGFGEDVDEFSVPKKASTRRKGL